MDKIKSEKIKNQLSDLYNNGEISEGKNLSEQINKIVGFYFNYKVFPSFNFSNLDKDTVFCHLNPGADPDSSTFYKDKIITCNNLDEFVNLYFKEVKDYPYNTFKSNNKECKVDNFDFKQALFLSGFPNNGVDFLSNDNYDNKETQLEDCYNVLTQKTQLELIPYPSKKFRSIFNSQKQSDKLIDIINPYFEEILNIITIQSRKYVIFGSAQYEYILRSYNKKNSIIIDKSDKFAFDIGMAKKVYFTMYKLKWNNKEFTAGVAHSFARQDLPNAFTKMKKYGELAAEKYLDFMYKH